MPLAGPRSSSNACQRWASRGAKTTRRCARWILQRLAIALTSVSAAAKALGLGWDLVDDLAVSRVCSMDYDHPGRFNGVRVHGVDEHKWRPVRGDGSSSFVTGLVDLTPLVGGIGPARLTDMVPGRSAKFAWPLAGFDTSRLWLDGLIAGAVATLVVFAFSQRVRQLEHL